MSGMFYLLAGLVGGVLGGMGFGGGTLLIPILTLLLDVPYRLAVWVNLVAFLPTAIVALSFHCRNKMVDWWSVGRAILCALLGVLIGFFLVGKLSDDIARKIFGIFMIVIGSISIFFVFFGYFMKNRKA